MDCQLQGYSEDEGGCDVADLVKALISLENQLKQQEDNQGPDEEIESRRGGDQFQPPYQTLEAHTQPLRPHSSFSPPADRSQYAGWRGAYRVYPPPVQHGAHGVTGEHREKQPYRYAYPPTPTVEEIQGREIIGEDRKNCNASDNIESGEETPHNIIIKVYREDGSSKSVLVQARTTVITLRNRLIKKWFTVPCPSLGLVERLPSLLLERELEEDEKVLSVLQHWTEGSQNRIVFCRRPNRHDLFRDPDRYRSLSKHHKPAKCTHSTAPSTHFSSLRDIEPHLEGTLWYKLEGKKRWRKETFLLKESALYILKRGKPDNQSSTRFACLKENYLYLGLNWQHRLKSPTQHCFALKPQYIQEVSPNSIKYLCCKTADALQLWMTGIRITRSRGKLWKNFRFLMSEAGDGEERKPPENQSVWTERNSDGFYSLFTEGINSDSGFSSLSETSTEVSSLKQHSSVGLIEAGAADGGNYLSVEELKITKLNQSKSIKQRNERPTSLNDWNSSHRRRSIHPPTLNLENSTVLNKHLNFPEIESKDGNKNPFLSPLGNFKEEQEGKCSQQSEPPHSFYLFNFISKKDFLLNLPSGPTVEELRSESSLYSDVSKYKYSPCCERSEVYDQSAVLFNEKGSPITAELKRHLEQQIENVYMKGCTNKEDIFLKDCITNKDAPLRDCTHRRFSMKDSTFNEIQKLGELHGYNSEVERQMEEARRIDNETVDRDLGWRSLTQPTLQYNLPSFSSTYRRISHEEMFNYNSCGRGEDWREEKPSLKNKPEDWREEKPSLDNQPEDWREEKPSLDNQPEDWREEIPFLDKQPEEWRGIKPSLDNQPEVWKEGISSLDDQTQNIDDYSLDWLDRLDRPIIPASMRNKRPGKDLTPGSSRTVKTRGEGSNIFLQYLYQVLSNESRVGENILDTAKAVCGSDSRQRDVSNWILESLRYYRAFSSDIQADRDINNTAHYNNSEQQPGPSILATSFTYMRENPHSSNKIPPLCSTLLAGEEEGIFSSPCSNYSESWQYLQSSAQHGLQQGANNQERWTKPTAQSMPQPNQVEKRTIDQKICENNNTERTGTPILNEFALPSFCSPSSVFHQNPISPQPRPFHPKFARENTFTARIEPVGLLTEQYQYHPSHNLRPEDGASRHETDVREESFSRSEQIFNQETLDKDNYVYLERPRKEKPNPPPRSEKTKLTFIN